MNLNSNIIRLSILALFTCAIQVQSKPWNPSKQLKLSLIYSIGYDGNILELSDYDIDRFEENILPGSTAPGSYDDLVQEFGSKFRVSSPRWLNGNRARLTYTLKYISFAGNSFNDRVNHSLFLSQGLMKWLDFVGSYFLIPNRYLRDYYDRDTKTVRSTEFSYNLYSAGFRFDLSKALRVDLRYEGYQVYYNRYFTEYDSEADGIRANIRYKVHPQLTLNCALKYRKSNNIGFEESSELIQSDPTLDAEYGDGSYGEEWFEFGLNWKSPQVLNRNWSVNLTHRIRHRYYTSDLPLEDDPFHRGREHLHQRLMFSLDSELVPSLDIGPFIEYEWRRTDSPRDYVIEVKDFDCFRAGMRFTYALW